MFTFYQIYNSISRMAFPDGDACSATFPHWWYEALNLVLWEVPPLLMQCILFWRVWGCTGRFLILFSNESHMWSMGLRSGLLGGHVRLCTSKWRVAVLLHIALAHKKYKHNDTNDVNTICVVDRLISDRQVINWPLNIAHSYWMTHCHRCLSCDIRWLISQFDQIV